MAETLMMKDIEKLINRKLNPLLEELETIDHMLGTLNHRLSNTNHRLAIVEGKQHNSSAGVLDSLVPVPLGDGKFPRAPVPANTASMVWGLGDTLPDGTANIWSKRKAFQLLKEYGEDGYSSESEGEHTPMARAARLQLAKRLGVTRAQLVDAAVLSAC